MLLAILVPIVVASLAFMAYLIRATVIARAVPRAEAVILSLIVNFFDTLGIGSFAPTTAWLKFRKLVPDRLIPPTMLVGLGPPTLAESIIFLLLLGVKVDPILLIGCSVSVLLGGLIGAPLVARTRVWVIQLVVAVALLIAAGLYGLTNLHMMPGGGTASTLPMTLTIIAIVANFLFGVLLNFGVGNYAPTLVILYRWRSFARKLIVLEPLYGQARRVLRDKIATHDIHFTGTGLDLGDHDEREDV